MGDNWYCQRATGRPKYETSNTSRLVGVASTTVDVVDQRCQPFLLVPLNRAPGTAEVAVPSQRQRTHSGLHSPIRVTSASKAHTISGAAEISTATASVVIPAPLLPGANDAPTSGMVPRCWVSGPAPVTIPAPPAGRARPNPPCRRRRLRPADSRGLEAATPQSGRFHTCRCSRQRLLCSHQE